MVESIAQQQDQYCGSSLYHEREPLGTTDSRKTQNKFFWMKTLPWKPTKVLSWWLQHDSTTGNNINFRVRKCWHFVGIGAYVVIRCSVPGYIPSDTMFAPVHCWIRQMVQAQQAVHRASNNWLSNCRKYKGNAVEQRSKSGPWVCTFPIKKNPTWIGECQSDWRNIEHKILYCDV